MRERSRHKSYGLFQPTYLAAQIASLSFSYLATGLAMFPVVLAEELIATIQEEFNVETPIQRKEPVWAYNIPFIFTNEELKRHPVTHVSFFSKKAFGIVSELGISLASSVVAGLTVATVGLIQVGIFTAMAALGSILIAAGVVLGGLAILARGLFIGPKNALNEAAEWLNSTFAV